MIKDVRYFDREKRAWLAKRQLSLDEKYKILNALCEEARLFGHFNEKDLLAGLDDDIRLAALLNSNVSDPAR